MLDAGAEGDKTAGARHDGAPDLAGVVEQHRFAPPISIPVRVGEETHRDLVGLAGVVMRERVGPEGVGVRIDPEQTALGRRIKHLAYGGVGWPPG